jgi:hypothetical protein
MTPQERLQKSLETLLTNYHNTYTNETQEAGLSFDGVYDLAQYLAERLPPSLTEDKYSKVVESQVSDRTLEELLMARLQYFESQMEAKGLSLNSASDIKVTIEGTPRDASLTWRIYTDGISVHSGESHTGIDELVRQVYMKKLLAPKLLKAQGY